jgi:ribosomal protein S12 methylthiotransferase accessory factor
MTPLSEHLLLAAAQERSGVVLGVRTVATNACDVPGIANAAVPSDEANAWQGTAGGVALGDPAQARKAAVAEALERYCAGRCVLPFKRRTELAAHELIDDDDWALYTPQQKAQTDFPWPMVQTPDDTFTPVFHLGNNHRMWVPQELVRLGLAQGRMRLPSTSSGLAAHSDHHLGPWLAVLRAMQEMLERDALAVTWLNGLGGAQIQLPAAMATVAQRMGAHVQAFDLTQRWNSHPVVAVAGCSALEGQARHAFGIACRATRAQAVEKAWLEWAQSLRYADYICRQSNTAIPVNPQELRRFDEHAAYYTAYPESWQHLPLLKNSYSHPEPVVLMDEKCPPAASQLQQLVSHLLNAGIDTYYRELTTPDVAQAGLRVMRVVAPALSPLHADERAPFLGGRLSDVAWRYPGAKAHSVFPNPWPHPLG